MQNNVITILKSSGWYEHREIDITPLLSYLKQNGYEFNEAQIDFFKEFSGLEIFLRCKGNINHTVKIDPMNPNIPSWAEVKYEEKINFNKEYLYLGEFVGEDIFLVIDRDLKVYGMYYDGLALLGNNFYEFIENFYQSIIQHSVIYLSNDTHLSVN